MKLFLPVVLFVLLGLSCLSLEAFSDAGVPVSIVAAPSLKAPAIAAPAAPTPMVAVPEVSAPPSWAQDLMVNAQKLPVIGPIVSKALLWLGIISSILTLIVGFLMAGVQVLMGAFNYAGLTAFVEKLAAFQSGKIMYWLKYLSLFNAKKPDPQ